MSDVGDRRFVAAPVSRTNFYIVGTLFFLGRLLHPMLRISRFPQEARISPAIFVAAFSVPLLGLAAILVWKSYRFSLLVAVAALDIGHWVLAALPFSYAAYWTVDATLWAYPMNLIAIAHIGFTLVIAATYARSVVAERHLPSSEKPKNAYEQGPTYERERGQAPSTRHPKSGWRRRLDKARKGKRRSRSRSVAPDLEDVPLTPAQVEARDIITRLRAELIGIANISKRKAHLRHLQRKYHPDKNPPEDEEMVKEVFYYVQKWWDDIGGIFVEEFRSQCA